MKKGALLCLKGFIREPKPTKKGIRVLLGILAYMSLNNPRAHTSEPEVRHHVKGP